MSYISAKEYFRKNIKLLDNPQGAQEEFILNLSRGLHDLVQALEEDISHLRREIDAMP